MQKKTIAVALTLQPLSTSMPTTCQNTQPIKTVTHSAFKPVVVASDKKIFNLLERLFMASNMPLLRNLVLDSIDSIKRSVFAGRSTEETVQMRANAKTGSHCVLLALFMLLLNVDHELKSTVMAYEFEDNKPKLVRFMHDLRHSHVIEFFTDELVDVSQFVLQCENSYILS